ncbi:MAG: tetratricopeptide repeat protein, partial [Zavarzinella sp.]|nr:tetratricopeptide repeat protein [Zavarzinella sp.]
MNETTEATSAAPATGSSAAPAPGPQSGPAPRRRYLTGRRLVAVLLVALAGLSAAGWRYRITRPDYRLARGEDYVARSDWAAARAMADRLAAAGYPDRAHLLRAEVYYGSQLPESALAECNRVRDSGVLGRRAAALAGRCLLDLGAFAEADRVFTVVVNADPDNADAHRGLAAVAFELGQTDRVVAELGEVIRLDPGDARPHRMLGEVYRDAGDMAHAVSAYQSALRIGNGLSAEARGEARFELATGLVDLSRFPEALEVLDAAAADGPLPPYM